MSVVVFVFMPVVVLVFVHGAEGNNPTMRGVILDGHNDLALRVWQGKTPQHVLLERAAEVGFAGGFFALSAEGPPVEPPAGRALLAPA